MQRVKEREESMASYEHKWADDIIALCREYCVNPHSVPKDTVMILAWAIKRDTAKLVTSSKAFDTEPESWREACLPPAVPEKYRQHSLWSAAPLGGGHTPPEGVTLKHYMDAEKDEGVRCCDECAKPLHVSFISTDQGLLFCDGECHASFLKRTKSKTCDFCGKEAFPRAGNKLGSYCSVECMDKHWREEMVTDEP
tara:strand:+ start:500 stop:1087 length:588 start_codon:yes stop_codon:yes gene_type:complete